MIQLSFQSHRGVAPTFLWWTNVMNHIRRVSAEERVVFTDVWTFSHSHDLRPEQKDVVWMKDVSRKFTSPEQTVVDSCAGIFTTPKGWMLLSRHWRFVWCKIDMACFKKPILGLWRGLWDKFYMRSRT